MKSTIAQSFIFLLSMLVIFSCDKKQEMPYYGVSIKAPKSLDTGQDDLGAEVLEVLAMSNSFSFLMLNRLFDEDNIESRSFSSLVLIDYLSKYDTNLFKACFPDNKAFESFEPYSESIETIFDYIRSNDSSINLSYYSDSIIYSEIRMELSFPIFDESVHNAEHRAVETPEGDICNIEYFTFKKNMGVYKADGFDAYELPIGNKSYSLLLIEPKKDILDYIKTFTEKDYMKIIENMDYNINTLSFPDISQDVVYKITPRADPLETSITYNIESNLRILRPTLAEIEARGLRTKPGIETKTEEECIERPFIYMLISKASNGVLYTGLYSYSQ